jgi:hypothetical protein
MLLLLLTSLQLLLPAVVLGSAFRAYNDSGCTVPLDAWAVTEPQLNYTSFTGACYNVSNIAGASSLLYTCARTTTPVLPGYVSFFYLAYASPSCGGTPIRSAYLPPVNVSSRISGGPENTCLVFGVADATLNYTDRYGIVSCAASAASNQATHVANRCALYWVGLLAGLLTAFFF